MDVFRHIPPHSAPGLHGITYQVLREAHFAAPVLLPTFFTALLQFSFKPEHWKRAKVVPVPKPDKGDYSLPKAYRPIYLQPCLAKVMEMIVTT